VKRIVEDIEVKVKKLIVKYEELKGESKVLEQEKLQVLNELSSKNSKIEQLQEKIKLMNISKSVDVSGDDVKKTRLKINEYVREIDKCIALLNK